MNNMNANVDAVTTIDMNFGAGPMGDGALGGGGGGGGAASLDDEEDGGVVAGDRAVGDRAARLQRVADDAARRMRVEEVSIGDVVLSGGEPAALVDAELAAVAGLEQRVAGVTRAEGAKYVMMNAPRTALEAIGEKLDGLSGALAGETADNRADGGAGNGASRTGDRADGSAGRSSGLNREIARDNPMRTAPACPPTPPPCAALRE